MADKISTVLIRDPFFVKVRIATRPCPLRLPQHVGGEANNAVLICDADLPNGERELTITFVMGEMQATACFNAEQENMLFHCLAALMEKRNSEGLAAIGATRTVQ